MAAPSAARPGVLMLVAVHHAKPDFDSLCAVAEVTQVTTGTRDDFIRDCHAGTYDNVVAISRTTRSPSARPCSRSPASWLTTAQLTGRFDAELVSCLPSSVRFICHNGAGYDQIDIAPYISVSNTPSAVDAATANTAIFLILGALRRAWAPQLSVRQGAWRADSPLGRDPDGLTLGILGMGGIGTTTARRAAAFGFRLQYHNRKPVAGLEAQFLGQGVPGYVGFEELLTSDVISVHLPLGPATRRLIGARELAMMKDGVVIVNTARGSIIDEDALVGSLESGKVWSVGLDVYEMEPEIHPGLLKHPAAVLLPHNGTATTDTQRRMEVLVIDNVRSAVTQGKLLTQVAEQRPSKV